MIEGLLRHVRAAFDEVPEAAPFVEEWPQVGRHREVQAASLPVCRWLEGMGGDGVVGAIRAASGALRWQQTYSAGDFGADFLNGYGWSEFVGLRGPLACEKIACGVLLLAPGMVYPLHAHEAEEVYLPISGVAEWQRGEEGFAQVAVGQPIHHAPWVPHAMRTGTEPLAALYLWRGGDLAAKSVIVGH
ncbi:MAG: dimethylsulfonioproprionate lyase family protein [Cypionkella sp.]